jgi:SAM-dependent methyltransferase
MYRPPKRQNSLKIEYIANMLQKPIPVFLKNFYYKAFILFFSGQTVECPICGIRMRRFKKISKLRATASGNLCPRCRSLERHRLLWLFLQNRTDLFNGHEKTVLHIAPEPCFKGRIENLKNMHYIVSDLNSSDPGKQIDITAINLQDQSVDVIICSHVLEHITEDVKAMRELSRVLKNTGWAILNVPVDYNRTITYEDSTITSLASRRNHFGQEDHVRIYGRDYPERLTNAGFSVDEIDFCKELGGEAESKHALLKDDFIYFCKKLIMQ